MKQYNIIASFDLSTHNYKVLNLLYLPLIGTQAFSLYTTLYAWVYQMNVESVELEILCSHLNMKEADFIHARQILEAFDLANTYSNTSLTTVKLKKPLTPKQFLSDTIFGAYYQSELGENHTEKMIKHFEVNNIDVSHMHNITTSFDDMFKFQSSNKLDIQTSLYENGGHKRAHIDSQIPFDAWFESLPKRYQKPTLLRPTIRQTIENIAFVYAFTIEDLTEVIKRLQVKDLASKEAINLQARLYFEETKRRLGVDKKEAVVEDKLSTISPLYIIEKYLKTDTNGYALETISTLIERNHVDMGIINTLILFVIKRKNGALPHVNYLEKILNDWLSRGVKTTADATKIVSQLETRYTQSKTYKKRSVEPDWLEDYMKELDNVEEAI
jgi:replication initiation and membrane attachment protein